MLLVLSCAEPRDSGGGHLVLPGKVCRAGGAQGRATVAHEEWASEDLEVSSLDGSLHSFDADVAIGGC